MPVVVIFAPLNDLHARAVAHEVQMAGAEAVILDTEDYPAKWAISAQIEETGSSYSLHLPDRVLRQTEITGLWWRRPKPPIIAPDVQAREQIQFCGEQARGLLRGLIVSLGPKVINPLAAEIAASYKVYQLHTAARFGLKIPPTLITSVPEEVKRFRREVGNDLIFKLVTGAPKRKLVETRVLEDAHMPLLDALRYAPLIFQQRVNKISDIRVTIIDSNCFAVECRTTKAAASLDWRLDSAVEYLPWTLPVDIARQIVAFHGSMGLRYGAVDFGLTSEGKYVFFETNTAGQFLFAEIHAGQPLAKTLAHALLQPECAPVISQSQANDRNFGPDYSQCTFQQTPRSSPSVDNVG